MGRSKQRRQGSQEQVWPQPHVMDSMVPPHILTHPPRPSTPKQWWETSHVPHNFPCFLLPVGCMWNLHVKRENKFMKELLIKPNILFKSNDLSGFIEWKLVQKLTESFCKHHRQISVSTFSLSFVKLTEALLSYTCIHKEWNFVPVKTAVVKVHEFRNKIIQ